VEPLKPELREALKKAHPGLTDAEIDRSEELLGQRMMCDAAKEPERFRQLEQERVDYIRRVIPNYLAVAQALRASKLPPKSADKTVITLKPRNS